MFTGIIQKVGHVIGARGAHLVIESGFLDVALGESVAVNGVCLTVTEFTSKGELFFHVSPETLTRSNLGEFQKDTRVNLERALRADERLSGHLVQGHVDGIAHLTHVAKAGDCFEVRFELAPDLARYCVEKGSITLNGVSLTVNTIAESLATIMLIPHTWENTNLSSLKVGDKVNVEVDVLAKYVEKLCLPYRKPSNI